MISKKLKNILIVMLVIPVCGICLSSAATYYMSPTGNDSNNGTAEGTPWATFNKAWGVLQPGDTLILLDGVYYQSINPSISGQPGNRITIKAKNDGKAIIDGQYTQIPVAMNRGYFTIEGITARYSSCAVYNTQTHNVTYRRCTGYDANTDENCHVFSANTGGNESDPSNILVEDCFAYGSGRKMFMYYSSYVNVVFRRCFAAWQEYKACGPIYTGPHWPWGDGIEIYNWGQPDVPVNGRVENCITFGMLPMYGFSLAPNPATTRANSFLGCMSIKIGMTWDGTTSMTWPCPNPCKPQQNCADFDSWGIRVGFAFREYSSGNAIVKDNLFQDLFAWGCAGAALGTQDGSPWPSGSTNNRLVRATFKNCGIGSPVPSVGANMEVKQACLNQFDEVADCYIEDVNGGPSHNGRGAQIYFRYVDGVLTDEPLWPWPMEQRVYDEIGISPTNELTSLLGINLSGNPTKLMLSAYPTTLAADGSGIAEITVKTCDNGDNFVYGSRTITFNITSGGGTLLGTNPVTTTNGIAVITYQSGTSAGTATITATSSGETDDSINITLVGNNPPNAPTGLQCEGLTDPVNVTIFNPELTWTFSDPDSGNTQSAYRILVADSQSALDSNNGNMWDSGKMSASVGRAGYSGSSLIVDTLYYWKVMTWDNLDAPSAYSQTATFRMMDRPFYGTPFQIPCKIECEDYDKGGEGIAFHETDTHVTGYYRTNDMDREVDIYDSGEGFFIGMNNAGE